MPASESFIDPVCGMTVTPASAAGVVNHNGRKIYFCSQHCVQRFNEDPERFTASTPQTQSQSQVIGISRRQKSPTIAGGNTYTCPMHPEVLRDGPSSCPKCGMALEPVTPFAG